MDNLQLDFHPLAPAGDIKANGCCDSLFPLLGEDVLAACPPLAGVGGGEKAFFLLLMV